MTTYEDVRAALVAKIAVLEAAYQNIRGKRDRTWEAWEALREESRLVLRQLFAEGNAEEDADRLWSKYLAVDAESKDAYRVHSSQPSYLTATSELREAVQELDTLDRQFGNEPGTVGE